MKPIVTFRDPDVSLWQSAAVPVDFLPLTVRFEDVPVVATALGHTGAFYNHGYALMDLDGPKAHMSYYQDSDPGTPLYEEDV